MDAASWLILPPPSSTVTTSRFFDDDIEDDDDHISDLEAEQSAAGAPGHLELSAQV